ncbi:hypothetical protein BAUCODRAFT_158856 [Baudoinia panamericana UAMH 10762]|uniref:Uncharacterized protein n=1 Tax=Baudoinia panamericana (strain UAMH 10762) TaxID=717646 RepID=M2N5F7_BAUPA|nr:uncharacterized protein BAUCODRAFT_158856 [Baudoinia panamericana UAMH 10762]EMC94279.1 hypothetical protein BAUCODRAFT_158856 [Baudoinia panamericana UAMH 10762]
MYNYEESTGQFGYCESGNQSLLLLYSCHSLVPFFACFLNGNLAMWEFERIAIDCEFQIVKVQRLAKHVQRSGRVSVVNSFREVIYDVFCYFAEEESKHKKLHPQRLKMGVYWADIKLRNGAARVMKVEDYPTQIHHEADLVVGHAISNDIKVFSPRVFDTVRIFTILSSMNHTATMELYHLAQSRGNCDNHDGGFGEYENGYGGCNDGYGGYEEVEAFTYDEDELEEQPAEDREEHAEDAGGLKTLPQLPLSAAGDFWQGAPASIKARNAATTAKVLIGEIAAVDKAAA